MKSVAFIWCILILSFVELTLCETEFSLMFKKSEAKLDSEDYPVELNEWIEKLNRNLANFVQ